MQINRTLPDNPHQRFRGLSIFFLNNNSQERAQSTERSHTRKRSDKEQSDSDKKDRDLLILLSDKPDLGRPKSAVWNSTARKLTINYQFLTTHRSAESRNGAACHSQEQNVHLIISLIRIHKHNQNSHNFENPGKTFKQ